MSRPGRKEFSLVRFSRKRLLGMNTGLQQGSRFEGRGVRDRGMRIQCFSRNRRMRVVATRNGCIHLSELGNAEIEHLNTIAAEPVGFKPDVVRL